MQEEQGRHEEHCPECPAYQVLSSLQIHVASAAHQLSLISHCFIHANAQGQFVIFIKTGEHLLSLHGCHGSNARDFQSNHLVGA